MGKQHLLFLLGLPFLSSAQRGPPTRNLNEGAIATSHVVNQYGDCTSYLYYGESRRAEGDIRSCWAGAISCKPLNGLALAEFVVGNGGYTYTVRELSNFGTTPQVWSYDMRDDDLWQCASSGTVFGKLFISTYIMSNQR